MRFRVVHATDYAYDAPVTLGPHVVRLRPRCDGTVHLLAHELSVDPAPAGRSESLDLHGNSVTHLWFSGETTHLRIESAFEAETRRVNPFDFLIDPGFARLPADGSAELAACRAARNTMPVAVLELSDRLARENGGDPLGFLSALNAHLCGAIVHDLRHDGEPYSPETTLALGVGACRDIAVLFVAACRAQGLAGRFVSGLPGAQQTHRPAPACLAGSVSAGRRLARLRSDLGARDRRRACRDRRGAFARRHDAGRGQLCRAGALAHDLSCGDRSGVNCRAGLLE